MEANYYYFSFRISSGINSCSNLNELLSNCLSQNKTVPSIVCKLSLLDHQKHCNVLELLQLRKSNLLQEPDYFTDYQSLTTLEMSHTENSLIHNDDSKKPIEEINLNANISSKSPVFGTTGYTNNRYLPKQNIFHNQSHIVNTNCSSFLNHSTCSRRHFISPKFKNYENKLCACDKILWNESITQSSKNPTVNSCHEFINISCVDDRPSKEMNKFSDKNKCEQDNQLNFNWSELVDSKEINDLFCELNLCDSVDTGESQFPMTMCHVQQSNTAALEDNLNTISQCLCSTPVSSYHKRPTPVTNSLSFIDVSNLNEQYLPAMDTSDDKIKLIKQQLPSKLCTLEKQVQKDQFQNSTGETFDLSAADCSRDLFNSSK